MKRTGLEARFQMADNRLKQAVCPFWLLIMAAIQEAHEVCRVHLAGLLTCVAAPPCCKGGRKTTVQQNKGAEKT